MLYRPIRRFLSRMLVPLNIVALIVVTTTFTSTVFTHTAAADCAGTKTAIINCSGPSNSDAGIWAILIQTINILTAGVGIAAVGGIVYAGFLYASAQDNPSQVSKSKTVITNVVIGIASYFLMYAGLNFIIPGGVFDQSLAVTTAPPPSNASGSGVTPGATNIPTTSNIASATYGFWIGSDNIAGCGEDYTYGPGSGIQDRALWADCLPRFQYQFNYLKNERHVTVAGFDEMGGGGFQHDSSTYNIVRNDPNWSITPESVTGDSPLAWNTTQWKEDSAIPFSIPGNWWRPNGTQGTWEREAVLLESIKGTHNRAWFINSHNMWGQAGLDTNKIRHDQVIAIANEVQTLRKKDGYPVFVLGDMNECATLPCNSYRIYESIGMHYIFGDGSPMPNPHFYDQIYATDGVKFSSGKTLMDWSLAINGNRTMTGRTGLQRPITDHPIVTGYVDWTGK